MPLKFPFRRRGLVSMNMAISFMRFSSGHKYVLFSLLLLSLQVEVQMEGEMRKCLTVLCLTICCTRTKEFLKGHVTSLYCNGLK
jgi:hypothetical protein